MSEAERRHLRSFSTAGIVLEAPPVASMTKVVRDAIGGCATVAGFAADEVDDARLVIDEAFVGMVSLADARVVVTADVSPGKLTVVMRAAAAPGASWLIDELRLVRSVIEVLTTDHGFGVTDGFVWVDLEFATVPRRPR